MHKAPPLCHTNCLDSPLYTIPRCSRVEGSTIHSMVSPAAPGPCCAVVWHQAARHPAASPARRHTHEHAGQQAAAQALRTTVVMGESVTREHVRHTIFCNAASGGTMGRLHIQQLSCLLAQCKNHRAYMLWRILQALSVLLFAKLS